MKVLLLVVRLYQENRREYVVVEGLVVRGLVEKVLDGVLVGRHHVEVLVSDHVGVGGLDVPVVAGSRLNVVEGRVLVDLEAGLVAEILDFEEVKV